MTGKHRARSPLVTATRLGSGGEYSLLGGFITETGYAIRSPSCPAPEYSLLSGFVTETIGGGANQDGTQAAARDDPTLDTR